MMLDPPHLHMATLINSLFPTNEKGAFWIWMISGKYGEEEDGW